MSEILKTEATTETLFVGVGGIGSDIVAKVAAQCKGAELDNVKFVVMDTDANSLKTVGDTSAIITKVQTSSSQTVKEYLENDDEARLHWFPNNSTLYGKTVSEGAGQVRAISRLALNNTIRTGEINKLYKEIDNLLLKDSGNFKQALRVVVVSSATGGTGSGMAMITAMLIREYLKDKYSEKKAIIRGFFVLPSVMDTVIESQMEKNSQYRNGYATIKEINAFMMIASGFGGTEDELKRYQDLHIDVPTPTGETRKLCCLPFDFCFLLEAADKNSEGLGSLEAYKDTAALCIYEQSIGPMQAKAFSLEDNIIKEFSGKEKYGRNRFGGIGASKIVYPYEDICDYVAYDRALKRIGGIESSSDWSAYDKAYQIDFKEYSKKRSFTDEKEPTRETSYIAALERDRNTLFGKDIMNNICGSEDIAEEVDDIIDDYIVELETYIKNSYAARDRNYTATTQIQTATYNYEDREQPKTDLPKLRMFDTNIRTQAFGFGKNLAKSIFMSAPLLVSSDVCPYHIEHLLKTKGGAVHPNSARYILYKLKLKFAERHDEIIALKNKAARNLRIYAAGYQESDDSSDFDILAKFSADKEKNIDALVEVASADRKVFDKIQGGFEDMWDKVNKHMHKYAELLVQYMIHTLNDATYEIAEEYISSICKEYERFYDSFSSKAASLVRRKDSLIEHLNNKKGSSEFFLCSTKEQLEEICNRVPEGRSGFLLPDDLCADIFETVKKNSELTRIRVYDKYAEGNMIDIFDTVLIEHFRKAVRDDSVEKLDLNIVQAVYFDKEVSEYLEKKKFGNDTFESRIFDDKAKKNELLEILRKGKKLATPGINGQSFVEPRDVKICTFNKSLLDMRDIKIKSFIEGQKVQAIPSDTVSKYELRFFRAIYNVTPDDIPLFKGPAKDRIAGESEDSAGIYFKAYQTYGRLIGPDSMKSATISTHIDKRWDAIVNMPEINFGVQYNEMIKAHSSLIYGLVLGLIRKFPSSKHDVNKRVFKIIDDEGGRIDLTVSNGTDCDEFYEVLDALYRDKESANMLIKAADEYSQVDVEKNYSYEQSAFVGFLKSFRIPGSHNHPTSLFEIPLVYYNSLPSALADNNELSIMIDSVIHIIEHMVRKYEREQDQNAYLCMLLERQFDLLIKSFNNDEYDEKFGLRKNTEIYDNIVISMVCQKIINKFRAVDISDCATKVRTLRDKIKEPEDLYE